MGTFSFSRPLNINHNVDKIILSNIKLLKLIKAKTNSTRTKKVFVEFSPRCCFAGSALLGIFIEHFQFFKWYNSDSLPTRNLNKSNHSLLNVIPLDSYF